MCPKRCSSTVRVGALVLRLSPEETTKQSLAKLYASLTVPHSDNLIAIKKLCLLRRLELMPEEYGVSKDKSDPVHPEGCSQCKPVQ